MKANLLIFINIAMCVVLIIFSLFLCWVYCSKKNINNIDNKIFKRLLIVNFLDLLANMGYLLVGYYNIDAHKLYEFAIRVHLCLSLIYYAYFITYVIIVANSFDTKFREKLEVNEKRYLKRLNIILFFIVILQMIVPGETYFTPNGEYVDGYMYIFLYSVDVIYAILAMKEVIRNRKKIDGDKLFPLKVFIILAIIDVIITTFFPFICVMMSLTTFLTFVMYFSIENPDIKMISQLELAKAQAERSNETKSNFLSGMSHDLRTPLNSIFGLSEMIVECDSLEEAHKDADDIISESESLMEVINGILDINKIDSNRMEIIRSDYDPNQLFDSLVKKSTIHLGSKDVEIKSNYKDLPHMLYGDKDKVEQIVRNLLSNAVKYTQRGFIYFNVICNNRRDKCEMTIAVRDTGIGIKEEQKKILFDKFKKTNQMSNIEGTGLGLAITKSLVEILDGTIEVESIYGEGSTFTVKLEQKIVEGKASPQENNSDSVAASSNAESEKMKQLRSKKVLLVVDDNKLNLKVASKMLEEFKFEVDMAHSGLECVEMLKNDKDKYGIIFMDIMMPEMNGVETMQKLKEIPDFSTPIIALTADAAEGSREKYLASGFDEYISKPIIKEILEKTLNKYVDINSIEVVADKNGNIEKSNL